MKLYKNNFSKEGFYRRFTCAKCVHIEKRRGLRWAQEKRERDKVEGNKELRTTNVC